MFLRSAKGQILFLAEQITLTGFKTLLGLRIIAQVATCKDTPNEAKTSSEQQQALKIILGNLHLALFFAQSFQF